MNVETFAAWEPNDRFLEQQAVDEAVTSRAQAIEQWKKRAAKKREPGGGLSEPTRRAAREGRIARVRTSGISFPERRSLDRERGSYLRALAETFLDSPPRPFAKIEDWFLLTVAP